MSNKYRAPSDGEGQRIWGRLWTGRNLTNWAWNSGLPSVQDPEPTTERGKRRKQKRG